MPKKCPRAENVTEKSHNFKCASDPAVMMVARMIVAGMDKKYELHPNYRVYVRQSGVTEAEDLIHSQVSMKDGGDLIQTPMALGGIGLCGGRSKDGRRFEFIEFTPDNKDCLRMNMTLQEARDIVSGRKKTIKFTRCTEAWFKRQKKMRT